MNSLSKEFANQRVEEPLSSSLFISNYHFAFLFLSKYVTRGIKLESIQLFQLPWFRGLKTRSLITPLNSKRPNCIYLTKLFVNRVSWLVNLIALGLWQDNVHTLRYERRLVGARRRLLSCVLKRKWIFAHAGTLFLAAWLHLHYFKNQNGLRSLPHTVKELNEWRIFTFLVFISFS